MNRFTKLIACANHKVIEHVQLTNHNKGEVWYLPIDEVVINHGYEHDTTLLYHRELVKKMIK